MRWRRRALKLKAALSQLSAVPSPADLDRLLLAAVEDASRPGAPPTYTAEQQCAIMALAVRKPVEFGLPIEQWTHRELAVYVDREKLVPGVSVRTVGRFLDEADIAPHRSKYWENPQIDDQAAFDAAVQAICRIYREAPDRLANGMHTVCIDEKTGIQALERIHPDRPARPGRPARLEFEYRRHGTQALIASFEVGNGTITGVRVGDTRTEADLVELVRDTLDADPEGDWTIVMDRLNTHMAEGLVRLVAERIGFHADLGRKAVEGIVETLASREAFLTDPQHRIRFVYTPRHCSWLNQIEIWFGILTRKALRRASFASVDELRERILRFVEYFNETMARAFSWTCRGRVLTA